MPLAGFLIDCSIKGIRVYLEDEKLKVEVPPGALGEEEREYLKANKSNIVDLFKKSSIRSNYNLGYLSRQQERLWIIDRIEPGSPQYNLPTALQLDGELNPKALQQALSAVVERHQVLRTTYHADDQEQVIQVIQHAVEVLLPAIDVSHLTGDEQSREISRVIEAEASAPFDLTSDIMLRARLVKRSSRSHILVLTMHHIAADGWSGGVLTRELSVLYAAFSRGLANPLSPLAVQYADYSHWQREWLQGEVLKTQLEYWVRQLQNLSAVHNLRLDRPRPSVPSYQGGLVNRQLSADVLKGLGALARSQGATLFMVLNAAFAALLSRYSGETDIVIGSPIANRERAELAPLVGFFVNTLVLRSDLSGDPSFIDLLAQSKERLFGAYKHQQLPFEILVDALQPARSLSHNPLFQIMLILQNNEQEELVMPGLKLSQMTQPLVIAKFDLTLEITEKGGEGLELKWEYAADLFDVATIGRMAEHFEVLLQGIIANPQAKVSRLPLLTAAEENCLLVEWNDTAAEYPRTCCIHELFEEQAAQNPSAVALVFGDQRLTYGQLNEQANRLAHYLIEERGVKPDTLVGICVERSPEMVVGILGILKAGGAYVPMDPEYPEQRIRYMLEDAELKTVLTQRHIQTKLGINDEQAVCLEDAEVQRRLANHKITNLDPKRLSLASHHLAYVIYTSGSTGKPKGSLLTHRGLCNLALAQIEGFGISSESRVLQFASIAFDAATSELFTTLSRGARLVLLPTESARSADAMSAIVGENSVTHATLPPSLLSVLDPAHLKSITTLVVAGEACPLQTAGLWSKGRRFINAYGPSETTVCATMGRYLPEESVLHIGKPLPNTRVYVMNGDMTLAPMGVAGELYIGGAGLARGYLNRPDLTRERFIPNPFYDKDDPASSERLYKTGDLVRWLPDGNLEFLGRMDHQVKIRGFRIEPGEIEYALRAQAMVKDAAVIAKESAKGKQLLAFVVLNAAQSGDGSPSRQIDTLRRHLKKELPDYMIPALFIPLDKLPVTPNGKVDRTALGKLEVVQSATPDAQEKPATPREILWADLWASVLGIDAGIIGIHANFFEMGGDSLQAMQLVSKANRVGVGITLKQIHSAGTLAELALMDDFRTIAAGSVPIVGEMPLTVDQAAFLSYDFYMPQWGIALKSCEWPAGLDPALLEEAINAVLAHHDALRARFTQEEGVWRQTIGEPRRQNIVSTVDLSHLDSDCVEQQVNDIARDLVQSFDLSTGPLLKIVQIDPGAGRPKRMLFANHHLISDGFSSQIINEDIATAHQQLLENRPVKLPAKTTSVKDWIARLEEYANSDELKQEAQYWLGLPWSEMPKLPVDFPGGEYKRYVGSHAEIQRSLSERDTSRIVNDLPRDHGVSTFDAIMAALVATLSVWLQNDKVLLCVHGSGRDVLPDMQDIDLSRTVGWLSYRRRVFLQKPRTDDISSMLKSVSAQLKALPNKGSGFGILSTYNKDDTVRNKLGAIPEPQIWLNYLGAHNADKEGSGEIALDKFIWTPPDGGEPRNIRVPFMHPDNQEAWYILLNSGIMNNRFHVHWRYSENLYRRETIETLAENYLAVLRAMADLPV